MCAVVQRTPLHPPVRTPPELRLVERRRRTAKLHLFTYLFGNALFWALWAAISVSAETWYWWATVPLAGWTVALALHLVHAYRRLS